MEDHPEWGFTARMYRERSLHLRMRRHSGLIPGLGKEAQKMERFSLETLSMPMRAGASKKRHHPADARRNRIANRSTDGFHICLQYEHNEISLSGMCQRE